MNPGCCLSPTEVNFVCLVVGPGALVQCGSLKLAKDLPARDWVTTHLVLLTACLWDLNKDFWVRMCLYPIGRHVFVNWICMYFVTQDYDCTFRDSNSLYWGQIQ